MPQLLHLALRLAAPPTVTIVSIGIEYGGSVGDGERDHELGAVAGLAVHRDRAPGGLDHLARDPEAEAETAVLAGADRALEALEDAGLLRRVDADAVVAHHQHGAIALAPQLDVDRLAAAVLHRVREQVRQELVEPG